MHTIERPNRHYRSLAGYRDMMRWYEAMLRRLRAPHHAYTVQTRFGETHILDAGPPDAPPLVLLHGINTNALVWLPQIDGLSRDLRIIAPDVPGFAGRSDPARIPYGGGHYGRWLVDVLDALRLDSATLAGASAGGVFALELAINAPVRIDRLALLNPCGISRFRWPYWLSFLPGVVPLVNWGNAHLLASRPLARRFVRMGTAPNLPLDPYLVEKSYLLLRHYRRAGAPPPFSDAELRRVHTPTLLLLGEHEIFTDPARMAARARALIADLTVETIPGAGHDMGKDRPDWLNARLRAFCATDPTPIYSQAGD